jgi:prevent-host-death family protein
MRGSAMKTMTAAEAKNKFGQFLDAAQREPVLVTKNDRPVGVFLSMADLEDTVLGERALKAHADGYVGPEASEALIKRLLNAEA